MAYILQKDTWFCYLDENRAVRHTQDIYMATRFDTIGKVNALLNKATQKLKGYKIVDLDTMQEVSEIHKVKRKRFSQTERTLIYNKNKGRCAICGKFVPYDVFTIDHAIPLAKGGTNEINNLQCTCKTCNLIKQDILPDDLMDKLTEIMLYQMRLSYNDNIWKKINYLRRKKQRRKITKTTNLLLKTLEKSIEKVRR